MHLENKFWMHCPSQLHVGQMSLYERLQPILRKGGRLKSMNLTARSVRLTANQIKVIAIVAMVIDHAAVVFVPDSFGGIWLLRMIGRLTAPIMCYFIAEGYYHTSNLKKYMGRLLMMALISHVPHNLCLGFDILYFCTATSVMVALLMGLIALTVWKRTNLPLMFKIFAVGCCCLVSYSADWNYIAVLWILGFGVFHADKARQLLAFLAGTGIYLLQPLIHGSSYPYISRLGVLFAIPLLFLFYKGARGSKSKCIKWGFYWFYPAHLLIIYVLSRLV